MGRKGLKTKTTIEVDSEVWAELVRQAAAEKRRISEVLEEILRRHYGLGEKDDR